MKPKQISSGFRCDMETLYNHFISYDVKSDAHNNHTHNADNNDDNNDQQISITLEPYICLRFSRFAQFWRELNFEFIFNGRQNEHELREFIEEAYLEVLSQLTNDKPFTRRVASLYLLYCLFVKQPIVRNGCALTIRINLFYLQTIRELVENAKQLEQFDVCFVWYKLLSLSAIDFIHVLRPMGPYFIRNSRVTSEAESQTDHYISQFRFAVIPQMDDLSQFHEQYRVLKDALTEEAPIRMNTVDQVQDNVFEVSRAKLDNLQIAHSTVYDSDQILALTDGKADDIVEEANVANDANNDDIGSRRRSIKNRAMTRNASVSGSGGDGNVTNRTVKTKKGKPAKKGNRSKK